MIIDAHHHLWVYNGREYGWIGRGDPIARSFGISDLRDVLLDSNVAGCIAVQARQTEEENQFLLECATACPQILGIVGWIDLRAVDIAKRIDAQRHQKIVGYRHVVEEERLDFLADPAFRRGVTAVLDAGLTYDLLINRNQLEYLPSFLSDLPAGRLIIDHGAKPDIKGRQIDEWRALMAVAARFPNLHCKISGLVTEADHGKWSHADIEPYLGALLSTFGLERLVWGSDWPVCLRAASYSDNLRLAQDFIDRHSPQAINAIFGQNALDFYHLPSPIS
jgi:L-fuconolactonase